MPRGADEWVGSKGLAKRLVDIGSLKLDPKNPRLHPRVSVKALKASLKRYGQRKPVVVRGDQVVAGNGLVEAARELGWSLVAAVSADDLSAEDARAYSIADNQTALLAEWDYENMRSVLDGMDDELRAPIIEFGDETLKTLGGNDWKSPGFDMDLDESNRHSAPPVYMVRCTAEEGVIVTGAIALVKQREGDDMSEGRCLELVCAEYLSGAE